MLAEVDNPTFPLVLDTVRTRVYEPNESRWSFRVAKRAAWHADSRQATYRGEGRGDEAPRGSAYCAREMLDRLMRCDVFASGGISSTLSVTSISYVGQAGRANRC